MLPRSAQLLRVRTTQSRLLSISIASQFCGSHEVFNNVKGNIGKKNDFLVELPSMNKRERIEMIIVRRFARFIDALTKVPLQSCVKPTSPDNYNATNTPVAVCLSDVPSESSIQTKTRIITASSVSTHLATPFSASGTTVNAFETDDPSTFEANASKTRSTGPVMRNLQALLADVFYTVDKASWQSAESVMEVTEQLEDLKRDLTSEERNGLYLLGGLVVGGLTAGKFMDFMTSDQ
jgi:hypothetical protein